MSEPLLARSRLQQFLQITKRPRVTLEGHLARIRLGSAQNHDLQNRTCVGLLTANGNLHWRSVVIDDCHNQGDWARMQSHPVG